MATGSDRFSKTPGAAIVAFAFDIPGSAAIARSNCLSDQRSLDNRKADRTPTTGLRVDSRAKAFLRQADRVALEEVGSRSVRRQDDRQAIGRVGSIQRLCEFRYARLASADGIEAPGEASKGASCWITSERALTRRSLPPVPDARQGFPIPEEDLLLSAMMGSQGARRSCKAPRNTKASSERKEDR